MGDLKGTGINYLRRRSSSGIYYWQAKIAGVARKGSLKTTSKSVAKSRLPSFLARARAKHEGGGELVVGEDECVTAGDWLRAWSDEQQLRVRLKGRTKRDVVGIVGVLAGERWAGMEIGKVDLKVLSEWWRGECGRLEPATMNGRLRVMRAAWKKAVRAGAVRVNVPEELERMPVTKKLLEVPTDEQLRAIVESVRMQRKRASDEVAAMIQFLAFSGMRPGEVKELRREHIKAEVIEVHGAEDGPKNRRERELPIVPQMEELIVDRGLREGSGKVFSIGSPYRALVAACDRLGFPRFDVYRLRHYFATVCIEQGVDVPTVALWLGHSDGGALLMRTYQHVRREHSRQQAARVRFG